MSRFKLRPRLFDDPKPSGTGLSSPFLPYSSVGDPPKIPRDPLWLEETEKGAVPDARRDEDGDGYHEISWLRMALKNAGEPFFKSYRLAHYFDDRKDPGVQGLVALHFLSTHSQKELSDLKTFAEERDYEGINVYFHFLASGKDDPLKKMGPYLHAYLNLIAVHSGYGVPDQLTLQNNPYGFSVTADGRWRVDCGTFTQFARAALKGIDGLSFSHVYMRGASHEQAHVVLLVSDEKHRHLLVDNGSVVYFENSDPEAYLIERFTKRGYETLGRGGSEWKPFSKHNVFYSKR